ncbi:c-type cytochrome [Mesorhizobium sp. B4-1-3]|uniref:c-type cytochrome n=1 Tax=Mesorhizobium sp. B4-1-3 TaxID=2589889 RepID=UPI001129238D|nr:c-type cytochrome [Mesorhizobium sp. B4-1-3]TPI10436.1 c-type cytochrome [Mesorhizobium sp. B4-1-3]
MTRRRGLVPVAGAAALGAVFVTLGSFAHAQIGDFARQERGRYLVAAGDCAACHTADDGKPFAGDRPIETPFGTIYSANITPDPETGIGAWTEEQFYRAMHEGLAADGRRLYPAFPYPWFTKVTRQDVDDIRAYLRTVAPVRAKPRDNEFIWPLNHRFAMAAWNGLFFTPGEFQPGKDKSAEWNRGAYLVEGLGHCGACHTPKNVFGSSKTSDAFQGAEVQNWFAPNLTGDKRTGLGSWSEEDIVALLKTGHNARTTAYGPMGAVVKDSTSKLTDQDLQAIATFLKSLPAFTPNSAGDADQKMLSAGKAIYGDDCAACHQLGGEGVERVFPSLRGDAVVQSEEPLSMLRLILNGGHAAATPKNPNDKTMPSFGWKLSDEQVAALATYVRNAWGNRAAPVTAETVRKLRSSTDSVTGAY